MSESKTESEYGFEIRSSIPVLRMFDEAKAKAFYLDYLGFEVDWESRFSPTAPLYLQIHLGKAVLHLNGHAQEDAPITEVNIPVLGLQNFCDYLIAKKADYPKPIPVDPRYQGRNTDLNLFDPFGNLLVFCSQTTEG
ncbi:Glyoxalase-like domain protein [Gimesia panareensis]|uniref:Bleomycin resistance protein n=1 Tax=Gimesia panareensis TaxID=2527978 RepID=A0A517QFD4_9PLAN|nr:glyoxalase superfamily protein [Gimesia panareensis]QDT30358.1 Glyoxalase-like domain protein [Gimesia panareensis]